jgi:hypothetical protein
MAGKSDALETSVLNMVFRNTSFTPPTPSVFISLHTADPTDAGTGTEVSGGSYARVAVATGTSGTGVGSGWSAPAAGAGTVMQTANTGVITFPNPTANWGTVTHFGIWSASSAGVLYYSGALTTSRTINNGDSQPSFAIGALVITED